MKPRGARPRHKWHRRVACAVGLVTSTNPDPSTLNPHLVHIEAVQGHALEQLLQLSLRHTHSPTRPTSLTRLVTAAATAAAAKAPHMSRAVALRAHTCLAVCVSVSLPLPYVRPSDRQGWRKTCVQVQSTMAALPLPHPIVVRVHKGAEEEELDGGLKAKHRLLGDHGRQLALGSSVALLYTHTRAHTNTENDSSRIWRHDCHCILLGVCMHTAAFHIQTAGRIQVDDRSCHRGTLSFICGHTNSSW